MNINYLISFLTAIEQNSISKAASSLHLTQSALSQQLQSIEKTLDSTLLIRSNKGIELTEEGNIVKNYSESLVNIYENMLKELDECRKSNISTLKIGACSAVGQYMLPCTLHLYKKNHDKIKFNLKVEENKRIIDGVLNYTYDIGFIDGKMESSTLESIDICSNHMVLVSSSSLNIDKEILSLEEVINYPLILPSSGTAYREVIDAMFSVKNIKNPTIEMELDSIEAIKASITASQCLSILPFSSIKKDVYLKALKKYEIKDNKPSCNISMIYSKKALSRKEINDFIRYIKLYGKETFC